MPGIGIHQAAMIAARQEHLGHAATHTRDGVDTQVRVVVVDRPEEADLLEARVNGGRVMVDLAAAEVAQPREGDRVTLTESGTIYELRGEPLRRSGGHSWRCAARRVST
jgi:hypothetical protein